MAETAADAVLVTRPEPGAGETAARVAALGWRPVLAPALVLTARDGDRAPPRGAQALLLTSRAAARAVPAAAAARLPVLAVGESTAAEARGRGFADVIAAPGGDAAALAALAGARLDPGSGPLLLAVGEGYGLELAAALRGRGFRVLRRIVYAATPAPALPDPARAALAGGEVATALFFSPRSVECVMSMIRAAGLGPAVPAIEALCISRRVARAAAAAATPLPWRATRAAALPTQDSMLQMLGHR